MAISACWDADGLSLWRLNRQPDPVLLSTPAAKALTSKVASWLYGRWAFCWDALFLGYDILSEGALDRDLGGSPYPQLAGENVYLRFGELPEDGRSYVLAFAKFGREHATSTYVGERSADGTYRIDLRRGMTGLDTRFLRSLIYFGRPLYVVRGQHVIGCIHTSARWTPIKGGWGW